MGGTVAGTVAVVYGILVAAGGIIGYARAGSRASLVMGGLFGLLLAITGAAALRGWAAGIPVAAALTGVLTVFFGYRFMQTGAFMPGGVMGLLSLAALLVLLLALRGR